MGNHFYDRPFWVRGLIQRLDYIIRKVDNMTDNQAHLDADVAAIATALAAIEAEVTALKAQPAAENIDFSGLDAAVARIQGDAPADASAPVDSTPVDTTPVDSAPVDTPVVDTPVTDAPVDDTPVTTDAPAGDAPAGDTGDAVAPVVGDGSAQVPAPDADATAPQDTADAVDDGVTTPDEVEAANANAGAANPQ